MTFVTPGCAAVRVLAGIRFVYVAADATEGAVTWTVMVQVPGGAGGVTLAGMVPPARVIVCVPALAVRVPPQVLVAFGGFATSKTPGKGSEMPMAVYADPVGF